MNAIAKFENLKDLIVELRGQSALIDSDVAELYRVETKRINEAVKNNPDKFPHDYMFEISEGEFADLRSKFSTTKFAKTRALPKAFTEKGLYMIATILKSKQKKKKMHQVKKLKISGFRRLHDIEIEMRPLMVMIGANGAGKTSFLDAVRLLSDSTQGKMSRTLNDMGGIADVITRGANDLALGSFMEVPGYLPLKYDLHIEPRGQTYSISRETLSQARVGFSEDRPFTHIESHYGNVRYYDIETDKLVKPPLEHNPLETSLSQVPNMFRQPEELRRILGSVTRYHFLDVGPRAPVKLPQQMKPAELPGAAGEDLVSFLYYLRESNRDRYELIEDTLKAAFPGFESLNFPPAAAGMLSMTWKEKQFKSPLYIHQLSEGTLRFLWLIALLQSPALSTVTMIDEPEVSLHPELLSHLAELLRESACRTQVIVATHSDRLVRFLEPKEVVVMDIDDNGFTTASWADALDIEEWLKEYSLDEIWRLGRMGGRS